MTTASAEEIKPGMIVSSPAFIYGRTTNTNLEELADDHMRGRPIPSRFSSGSSRNTSSMIWSSSMAAVEQEERRSVARDWNQPSLIDRCARVTVIGMQ